MATRSASVSRSLVTSVLSLALSACGGATQAPTQAASEPPPDDSEAGEWRPSELAPSESPPSTPTTAEASARRFDERERALLCGGSSLTTGAASFEAVLGQVQAGDRTLGDTATIARAVTDAKCRDAVDELNNAFQQLAASSRTLCDYQFARGIGISGDELVARTSALLSAIDDRVAAIASNDGQGCPLQAKRLAADAERWRGQRERVCSPTAEQRAVSSCGVEASDPAQQQSAKSYCDALAANGMVDAALSRPLEQCMARASRAAP